MATKKKVKQNPISKITSDKQEKESEEVKEVKEWLQKIKFAKKVKDDWRQQFRVDLAYQYRDGNQRPQNVNANEWITVNRIYSNLKAELPSLYSNDPYFFIKLATTYTPDPMKIVLYEKRGKIRQSMLNYLKRELKLKEKVRLSVLDAFFEYGVGKTHYNADMVDNPKKGMQLTSDDGTPVFEESTGEPMMEPERLPVNEQYKITRIHPDDFLFDSDAGPLDDTWAWVAEIIRMPLEDAKNDSRYRKSVRNKLQATEITEEQAEQERQRRKNKRRAQEEIKPTMAIMYEVYNLKTGEWFVVSDGAHEYLVKPDSVPKGTEKHPYSILRLGLLRDDSPYPIPPVSQWLDVQYEYNALMSKILTHRKRFNRKYVMFDQAFDDPDSAASKIETGEDGTVVRSNGTYPGPPIVPVQDAQLDNNHIQEAILLGNAFEMLSTGSNQQGSGRGIDSATEAGIVEKRVSIREGDNLSLIMDFTTEIGRKIDQLVQAFISKDQAVKVIGPEGEYWELVKATDYENIEGEFEFSVNAGSTIPQLPEIERAQWMQFLGLIAQAPQLALSKSLLKRTAEMHRIEDDTMLDEIHEMAKKLMGGQLTPPGQMGSPQGQPDMTTLTQSLMGGAQGINNIRGGQQ